jgi:coenzyme F420-reducing hydrogenase alpha subunit
VTQDFTSVSLRHPQDYPMNAGRIVSSAGLDIASSAFDAHFTEHQVPHSTALHCLLDGKPYLVGPLARINLNIDRLPPAVQALLDEIGIAWPSRNPFHGIVARAVEIYFAIIEAMEILRDYQVPAQPFVEAQMQSGTGFGCTEAPRGLLWHRYDIDATGIIRSARIVPPTSQNQARIEEDLRLSLEAYGLEHNDQELCVRGETVIRNYDPCISCATHFLDLRVDRE